MATELEIYTDVYDWLKSILPSAVIVQGYQNNVPVPKNAIVMTILFVIDLDQLSNEFIDDSIVVFESQQVKMQLDFYGDQAMNDATKASVIFKSPITTELMKSIQPLYCSKPRNMTFVNEAGQYEKRYMIELELQHNPSYKKAVGSTNTIPEIGIDNV